MSVVGLREFRRPLLVSIQANGSLLSTGASTITVAVGKAYGDSQADSPISDQQ